MAALLAIAAAGCSAEQTQPAEAPDVDVQGGQLPRYDVNWADVDVGTSERTVTVPVVRIERETREITVPFIDVNAPGAGDREERTISMELDVPNAGYQLSIDEVRAAEDDLWVIARLTEAQDPGAQAMTRVSDHVVVNVPEDLDVRKVVVGERPTGVYNQQYQFVESMDALEQRVPQGARVLYRAAASGSTSE
jgi:hypothetical protein